MSELSSEPQDEIGCVESDSGYNLKEDKRVACSAPLVATWNPPKFKVARSSRARGTWAARRGAEQGGGEGPARALGPISFPLRPCVESRVGGSGGRRTAAFHRADPGRRHRPQAPSQDLFIAHSGQVTTTSVPLFVPPLLTRVRPYPPVVSLSLRGAKVRSPG